MLEEKQQHNWSTLCTCSWNMFRWWRNKDCSWLKSRFFWLWFCCFKGQIHKVCLFRSLLATTTALTLKSTLSSAQTITVNTQRRGTHERAEWEWRCPFSTFDSESFRLCLSNRGGDRLNFHCFVYNINMFQVLLFYSGFTLLLITHHWRCC